MGYFGIINVMYDFVFVAITDYFVVHKSHGFNLKPSLIKVSVKIFPHKRVIVTVPCDTLESIGCINFSFP